MPKEKSRLAFKKYLNQLSPSYNSDKWIINGKSRISVYYPRRYGDALQKHDPIAFEVSYNEWKRNV